MKKSNSRQILADNIAALMARHPDLASQNAVAQKAKVAQSHIGRIRRMESSATIDMLDALADAFGVQPWELLTDTQATRQAALERMMFGQPVEDERVEQAYSRPSKVVAMKQRRRK